MGKHWTGPGWGSGCLIHFCSKIKHQLGLFFSALFKKYTYPLFYFCSKINNSLQPCSKNTHTRYSVFCSKINNSLCPPLWARLSLAGLCRAKFAQTLCFFLSYTSTTSTFVSSNVASLITVCIHNVLRRVL